MKEYSEDIYFSIFGNAGSGGRVIDSGRVLNDEFRRMYVYRGWL